MPPVRVADRAKDPLIDDRISMAGTKSVPIDAPLSIRRSLNLVLSKVLPDQLDRSP